MSFIRKNLKYFFLKTKTLFLLDKINYLTAYLKNFSKNEKFRKAYPNFKIPPDYFLYETYKLNYNEYKQDGDLTAKELVEWTQKYLPEKSTILEWGSGVARIIRHFPRYVNSNTKLFAADINDEMIDWSKKNIDNIMFEKIDYLPPTHFNDNQFNLIYAISVFTHIESKNQYDWIKEINRILTGGVYFFLQHMGVNTLKICGNQIRKSFWGKDILQYYISKKVIA